MQVLDHVAEDLALERKEVIYQDSKKGPEEGLEMSFIITKSPKAIVEAYESFASPSSMSSFAFPAAKWVHYFKHHFSYHPALFYHYHPQTAVAIISVNGVPYARTLCYDRFGDGKFIQHGQVYGKFARIMKNIMKHKNIANSWAKVQTKKEFIVPGKRVKLGENEKKQPVYEYYLMHPFFDELAPIDVGWNKKTKEFTLGPTFTGCIIDGGTHKGYATAGRITEIIKKYKENPKQEKDPNDEIDWGYGESWNQHGMFH